MGDATLGQVALFLTLLGLIDALLAWPVAVAVGGLHAETLSSIPWKFLVSTAALGLLFNFFINFGIAVTYPLFISLGTVLGIPLNALADLIFRGIAFSAWKIVSTEFILVGFVMLLLPRSAALQVQAFARLLCVCVKRKTPDIPQDEESLISNQINPD